MSIANIIIIGAAWLFCGVISWGLMYAYFSRKWPTLTESRVPHVVLGAIFGPVMLLTGIYFLVSVNGRADTFKYGFKL